MVRAAAARLHKIAAANLTFAAAIILRGRPVRREPQAVEGDFVLQRLPQPSAAGPYYRRRRIRGLRPAEYAYDGVVWLRECRETFSVHRFRGAARIYERRQVRQSVGFDADSALG